MWGEKTTMVWKLLSPSLGMISQIGKVLRDCEMILIPWYKNHLSSIDTRRFRANFVRKKDIENGTIIQSIACDFFVLAKMHPSQGTR